MPRRVTDYVAGFAFSRDQRQVLLVRKRRPAWQRGRYNGIGGHIEEGELPVEAMRREFFEETGVFTSVRDWRHFAVVCTDQSRVFMFTATLDGLDSARNMTDERIALIDVENVAATRTVPNLAWLIPLALRVRDLPVPAVVHEIAHYEVA
jgi:8-oxo-dGTP diphosphatase